MSAVEALNSVCVAITVQSFWVLGAWLAARWRDREWAVGIARMLILQGAFLAMIDFGVYVARRGHFQEMFPHLRRESPRQSSAAGMSEATSLARAY